MRFRLIVGMISFTWAIAGAGMASLGMGPQNMVLSSGTMKQVSFPHSKHQEALKDCNACHSLFPEEVGSIQRMISEGALKKKTVMTACIKCHRRMKQAGLLTGPVSCKKCHRIELSDE